MQAERTLSKLRLELWKPNHPRWSELLAVVEEEDQTNYLNFDAEFHEASHLLVAVQDEAIAGFLRAVIQAIGPDMGCPTLEFKGEPLREAKILAFAVRPAFQNQSVGRALQSELIRLAKTWSCYQIRSHSDGHRKANHHLKLSLGFAAHPTIRGDDKEGAYFLMPLQREKQIL